MMHHILKIAFRNIRKNKTYTFINIFGLSVGLACSIIIVLYVINELTYDHFHPDSDRVFRVVTKQNSATSGVIYRATAPAPLAPTLKKELPQVENAIRIVPPYENADNVLVLRKNRRFFERRIFFVDPEIFDFFDIPFLRGTPHRALREADTVLITRRMAEKYFGDEDPVGKRIRMEFDYDIWNAPVKLQSFKITGVIENPRKNSHLKYNMLVSIETLKTNLKSFDSDWTNFHRKITYVKLKKGVDAEMAEKLLAPYAAEMARQFEQKYKRKHFGVAYQLQNIRDIHMARQDIREIEPRGNWMYIYIYSIIALLVLSIGCMNFINLSTVVSTTRAREVGMRKVIGARRVQLVWQFLSESKLITLISFLFAIGIAFLLLPLFNRMAGTELSISGIFNPLVMLSMLGLFLLVSLSSGIFPALILTRFKPVSILQGKFTFRLKGAVMQRILVIGQFAISIFLIICTLFIFKQLNFMKGRALGFDREQKLILRVKSNLSHLRRDFKDIKGSFVQYEGIFGASVSNFVPGDKRNAWYGLWKAGMDRKGIKGFTALCCGADFVPLYRIKLLEGRGFRPDPADRNGAFILNESGARHLGFHRPLDAVGKRYTTHYSTKTKTIIGIVKDFHYRGMKVKTEPMVLDIEPSLFSAITLKIDTHQLSQVMTNIRQVWESHFPGVPFEYSFLDESFDQVYRYETQMGQLLRIITLLGIIIAVLGLTGLVAFIAWKREKEIGVRKVLGATVADIVRMLSRQFVWMIISAIVIAVPLSWVAMSRWLDNFAYRTGLSPNVFILSAAAALIVALLAVALQGIKAAGRNPIDCLRNE